MPAQTPIFGLPYMVGTDPPCFGPGTGCDNLESVFCDFAEIVEGLLDANDAIAGRTATAIPMAMIQIIAETPVDVDFFFTVPFDTVIFDTDNMVTAGSAGFEIRPQRNGQYHIDFSANVHEDSAGAFAGVAAQLEIVLGNDELAPNVAIATATCILGSSSQGFPLSSTFYQFSNTAPIPRSIFVQQLGGTLPELKLTAATLAVYWHSDL